MTLPVGSRPPSPIAGSHVEGQAPASPYAQQRGSTELRATDGPLGGLSTRPASRTSQRPDAAGSPQAESTEHSPVDSLSTLRDEIDSATDLDKLHRLTGMVASRADSQAIPASSEHAPETLFLTIGGKMSEAMTRIAPIQAEEHTAQLAQSISAFSRMRPPALAAAGVYHASTLINGTLPRAAQQAVFDQSLAAARNLPAGNRANILIALQTAIFRSPEPTTPDSLRDARTNLSGIANSTRGIPPEQLKPIVEGLAADPKLFLLALNEGDWQSSFNAIVDASNGLSSGDRQEVRKRLSDSLDTIEQNIGPAGINDARAHLKTL
ncbi:hypothetical protein [Burkholderia sp. YIM B11467]